MLFAKLLISYSPKDSINPFLESIKSERRKLYYMLERHVIKYLAPGWFALVMGTGGLANVLYQFVSRNIRFLPQSGPLLSESF